MLSANSPNAKYLAGLAALLAVAFALGVLPADPETMTLFLVGTAVTFTATFYFLARTLTTDVVEISWRRNAVGFLLAGSGVLVWMYATLVFEIDLTAPTPLARVLLVLVLAGLAVGLADVGWTTGKLAESLAIRRARGNA